MGVFQQPALFLLSLTKKISIIICTVESQEEFNHQQEVKTSS